jgi:hypothetical protein
MIEDFNTPAWADHHEKLSADVSAGITRLARWLRRRAKTKAEAPAVTPRRRTGLRPKPRTSGS